MESLKQGNSGQRKNHVSYDDFIPTRQSLLSRLKNWEDQESWREFFDIYGRLIHGLARKCGLTDAEGQDVVQETLLTVARKMPGFRYDPSIGSFKGWLFQVTRRRIADQFRKRPAPNVSRPKEQENDRTATVERIADWNSPDMEAVWDRDWQQNLLQAALQRLKARVSPKQYQMFDLYVTQEYPMETVTQTLGVNRAQVYMAKMRLSRLLKEEVQQLSARGC